MSVLLGALLAGGVGLAFYSYLLRSIQDTEVPSPVATNVIFMTNVTVRQEVTPAREPQPAPAVSSRVVVPPPPVKPPKVNPAPAPKPVPPPPSKPKIEPAPRRDYDWFGGGSRSPREVKFELLNGAALNLVPLKSGEGFLWMSRLPVSVGAWRDFRPGDFPDLKAIASAIPGDDELCSALAEHQVEEYCEYLTAKYRLSLPKDFVFRPATAAELSVAYAEEATRRRCEITGRQMEVCVGSASAVRASRFKNLSRSLSGHGEWNRFGVSNDGRLLVAGLAMPHASGICDLSAPSETVIWPHIVLTPRVK